MLKLSRNSLGENNKSCSTPHQESSKIEFAIFPIFYNFLEILQDSAKHMYYWRFKCQEGSESLRFLTNMSLLCRSTLEKKSPLQLGPLGRPAAVWPQILRGLAGVRPGKGRGRALGPPRTSLRSEKEAGRLLRAGRQAQGGGCRRNGAPGDDVGSAGQPVALEAVVEGCGGEGVHKRPSCGVEGEAHRGRPWQPWRARADKPQPPFIVMNGETLRR
jgi:hypothetical protein